MKKQKNLTIREFSEIHNIPRRTITLWCANGILEGAFREATPFGDIWYIPRVVSDNFNKLELPKKGRPKQQKELKAA